MRSSHLMFSTRLAVESVSRAPLRAGLTSLGILFGVASVIAMLAIGRGAKQEILSQMRLLGSNNVIVTPILEQKEGQDEGEATAASNAPKRASPGLSEYDVRSILEVVPDVETASGEIVVEMPISREGWRRTGKLVGIERSYFDLINLPVVEGRMFADQQMELGMPVAIIGHGVKARFFPGQSPVGQRIKVGALWYTVIGVAGNRQINVQVAAKLGIRDATMDVYVPLRTMLVRVRNRANVAPTKPEDAQSRAARRYMQAMNEANSRAKDEETADQRTERLNYNQLDRVIIRVKDADHVQGVADLTRRVLLRRHNQVVDFEINVPEAMLKQEQRTRTIFNIVLGSIASISLLVGGIGIMNIMLATVLERIREIGLRRAVGARRVDILSQFLAEAVLISLGGGLTGIFLGAAFSMGIEKFAQIPTSVSAFSVALSFGVSITIGIAFGIVPAWRAAEQDPVDSLRYE